MHDAVQLGLHPSVLQEICSSTRSHKSISIISMAQQHQQCFTNLISEFRKDVTLQYFDMQKPTYIFTDAHKTGMRAITSSGWKHWISQASVNCITLYNHSWTTLSTNRHRSYSRRLWSITFSQLTSWFSQTNHSGHWPQATHFNL